MSWRDLLAYWRDHHVDGCPPSRADIDPPLEQPRLLPNLMLIGVGNDGFRIRLVGSEVTRKAGMDLTGHILDPVNAEGRSIPKFVVLVRKVVVAKAPVLYFAGRSRETAFGAMGLLLPLVDRSGTVEMVLGGLFHEFAPAREAPDAWHPDDLIELALEDEMKRATHVRHGRGE